MSRRSSIHARIAFLFSIFTIGPINCQAQTAVAPDRITSVSTDPSTSSIVLRTETARPIVAPQIQYLAGADGKTIFVADFAGVQYGLPTHIVPLAGSHSVEKPASRPESGIQEIRIGQFQSYPATMRISASSYDPRSFKALSFQARPGSLVIKWGSLRHPATPEAHAQKPCNPVQQFSGSRLIEPRGEEKTAAAIIKEYARSPAAKTADVSLMRTADTTDGVISRQEKQLGRSRTEERASARERANDVIDSAPDYRAGTDSRERRTRLLSEKPPQKTNSARERRSADVPSAPPAIPEVRATQNLSAAPGVAPPHDDSRKKRDSQRIDPVGSGPPSAVARTFKINRPATEESSNPADIWKRIFKGQPDGGNMPSAPPIKERSNEIKSENQPPAPASGSDGEPGKIAQSESADNESQAANNKVSLLVAEPVQGDMKVARVQVAAEKKLSYKTFRLHDPERYVIDFDNLPQLLDSELPKLSVESPVQALRAGSPNGDDLVTRLVLVLKDDQFEVTDVLNKDGTAVTFNVRPAFALLDQSSVLAEKTIVIDAGHGGSDPGAQRAGVQEKELTLAIANCLRRRLEALGARTIMTRQDDSFVSLEERVRITNTSGADLFVSVHINALESTSQIYGVETYYQTEQSKPLAECIHQQLVSVLGVPDRSVRKARFYVVNHTPVPAVLAEVGYISNKEERERLISSDYQLKISDALAQGVILYLASSKDRPSGTIDGKVPSGDEVGMKAPTGQKIADLANVPAGAPK
ncbi:MAG TPA: N-acetylmuramoyl-L-alanine amidase [Candidatus Obscuribacterales bacterium]